MSARDGATTSGPPEVLGAVWEALSHVPDPELQLDVVALGFVYDISVSDNSIEITMTLTTPGCPASQSIPAIAQQAVRDATGDSRYVDIEVVWDPPWTPAMIDEEAAAAAGLRVRR